MKYYLGIYYCALFSFCLAQEDSIPQIKSEFEYSYQAEMKADSSIELGDYAWYNQKGDHHHYHYKPGRLLTSLAYFNNEGELMDSMQMELNEDGQKIVLRRYSLENKKVHLADIRYFYYDAKGFCYTDSTFNEDGDFLYAGKSAKDYDQNVEFTLVFNAKGERLHQVTKKLDRNGRLKKHEMKTFNDEVDFTTYFYESTDSSERSEMTIDSYGDTVSYDHYFYDENGMLKSHICFDNMVMNPAQEFSFSYEYNANGDWIKQYIYSAGKLAYVIERRIVYWTD